MRPQKERLGKGVPVSDNTKINFAKLILAEGITKGLSDPARKLAGSEVMTALDANPREEQHFPSTKLLRALVVDLDSVDLDLLTKATKLTTSMQIRMADLAMEGFSNDPDALVDAVALVTMLEKSEDADAARTILQLVPYERYEKTLASLLASNVITPEQAVGLTHESVPPHARETELPSVSGGHTVRCAPPSFADHHTEQSFAEQPTERPPEQPTEQPQEPAAEQPPVSDSGMLLKKDRKKAANH